MAKTPLNIPFHKSQKNLDRYRQKKYINSPGFDLAYDSPLTTPNKKSLKFT